MKLVVIGRGGQLSLALTEAGAEPCLGQDQADLAAPGQAAAAVRDATPEVIINAAAYTAVDAAESDREAAFRVNGEAVGEIAAAARETGAALIHISTDYVYDGTKPAPYLETDPVDPINVYGASKLAGEQAALEANPRTVVLRTSWVYAPWGRNFVATMLRLGRERAKLRIFDDQWGRPTSAEDLAAACLTIAEQIRGTPDAAPIWGVHHYSGGGEPTTWAGFAAAIFDAAQGHGGPSPEIEAIPTSAYPTPARRPANSVLDCTRVTAAFGVAPVPWRHALARTIARMAESGNL